jgi:hypothetical protein
MRRFSTILVIALSLLFLVSINSAQQTSSTTVPNLIRYSGTLKDAQGAALSSDALGVTFTIYKQQDGGAAVWLETQNVTPDANGQYSVVLGSTTAKGLPSDLFSRQEERWLGVQVQGQAEQARVLLVSVPYAFKAHEAETLGGLPASAFVKAETSDASNGIPVITVGSVSNAAGTLKGVGHSISPKDCLPGAQDHVAIWDSTCNLVDTPSSGTATVNGNFNLASDADSYWVGGSTILTIGAGRYQGNLFVGLDAGSNNSGVANTFSGSGAGHANTNGDWNTFFGASAGYINTSATKNAFFGAYAGYSNTGHDNTFLGEDAGRSNTDGNTNTFAGQQAGISNTTGNVNAFFGYSAGYSNTTGAFNTFSGSLAGQFNTIGSSNAFFGHLAGKFNTTGADNTFLGTGAGYYNSTGSSNIYLGTSAGSNTAAGSNNIEIGNQGSSADNNTIRVGTQGTQTSTYIAGIFGAATTAGSPVFIDSTGKLGTGGGTYSFSMLSGALLNGQFSGTYSNAVTLSNPSNVYYGNGSNLTGLVVGAGSPFYVQNGTALQTGANFNIDGSGTAHSFNSITNFQIGGTSVLSVGHLSLSNVLVGVDAGTNNTTGSNSVFLGYRAGYSNTTGAYNIFSGYKAGYSNTSGTSNVFFGYLAGYSNTDSANTFVGGNAGRDHAAGAGNTFTGDSAGKTHTGGSNNTLYGYHTGSQNAPFTGNNNIYIGALAGFNVGTGNNNIDIGNRGVAGDKSTIRLGQQGTQNAIYIAGIAGVTAGDSHVCVVTVGDNTGQLGVCNPANQPAGDLQTELQKQQSVVAAQQDVIKAQQQQINDLQQRLSRLESLIAKK